MVHSCSSLGCPCCCSTPSGALAAFAADLEQHCWKLCLSGCLVLSSFAMKTPPFSWFLISKPSGVGFLKAASVCEEQGVSSALPRHPNGQGWLAVTFPSNGLQLLAGVYPAPCLTLKCISPRETFVPELKPWLLVWGRFVYCSNQLALSVFPSLSLAITYKSLQLIQLNTGDGF